MNTEFIMQRKKSKRQNLFNFLRSRLFLSFFSIFALSVLIVGMIGFFFVHRMTNEENLELRKNLIEATRDSIDSEFEKLRAYSLSSSQIGWIKKIANMQGSRIDERRVTLHQSMDYIHSLKNYLEGNHYISELGIYFNSKETFYLGSGQINSLDWTFGKNYVYDELTIQEWKLLLDSQNDDTILHEQTISYYGRSAFQGLTYLQTIPVQVTDEPLATLFAIFDEAKLRDALSGALLIEEASVFILNGDFETILNYNNLAVDETKFRNFCSGEKEQIDRSRYDGFLVLSIPSEITDWTYFIILNENYFPTQYTYSKYFFIIVMVVFFVLGVMVLFGVVKYYYRPTAKMVNTLSTKFAIENSEKQKDEFTMLNRIVGYISDHEALLELREKDFEETIRKNEILLYLRGFRSLDEIKELFAFPYCAVAIWRLKKLEIGAEKEITGAISRCAKEFGLQMTNIALSDDETVIAINSGNRENVVQSLQMLSVERHADEYEPIVMTVGDVYEDPAYLPRSFREAQYVMQSVKKTQEEKLCWYGQARNKYSIYYFYPLETEHMIEQYICAGNARSANALIHSIIDENNLCAEMSSTGKKYLFYDIFATILKAMGKRNMKGTHLLDDYQNMSLEQMKCQLADTVQSICDQLHTESSDENHLYFENILNYVKDNFTSPELSEKDIAEKYFISVTHFCRLFKERVGCTFSDYICTKRMEEACRQLKTDKSVEEIARAVGYTDVSSLRKLFKRICGVTPTEYRKRIS